MITQKNFQLIAPTTGGATQEFSSEGGQSVSASALAGVETADIEKLAGTEWVPVTDGEGNNSLTATDPVGFIESPGYYRVVLSATVATCGIYLN